MSRVVVDASTGAVTVAEMTEADLAQRTVDISNSIDKAMMDLRAQRNAILTDCDWTQLPDAPLTTEQRAAWATYRQALRDLPDNTEDPANPDWPVAP